MKTALLISLGASAALAQFGSFGKPCTAKGDACGDGELKNCMIYSDGCRNFKCQQKDGKNVIVEEMESNPIYCVQPTCGLYNPSCVEEYPEEEEADKDSKWKDLVPDWIYKMWDEETIEKIPKALQNFNPATVWDTQLDKISQDQADAYCSLQNFELPNRTVRGKEIVIADLCKRSPLCEWEEEELDVEKVLDKVIGFFNGEELYEGTCVATDMSEFVGNDMTLGEFVDYVVKNTKVKDGEVTIEGLDDILDMDKLGDFDMLDWAGMMKEADEFTFCNWIEMEALCEASWAFCKWKDDECVEKQWEETKDDMGDMVDDMRDTVNKWNWYDSFASCEVIPAKMLCWENAGWCRWVGTEGDEDEGNCVTARDWRDEIDCIEKGDGILESLGKCVDQAMDEAAKSCNKIPAKWGCLFLCEWDEERDECAPNRDEAERSEEEASEGKSPLINGGERFDCGSIDFFFCAAAFWSCKWDQKSSTCMAIDMDDKDDDRDACACEKILDPVCAKDKDGKDLEFGNACLAKCKGYKKFAPTKCGGDEKNFTCMTGQDRFFGDKPRWTKSDSCEPAVDIECGLGTAWSWASVENCDACCEDGKCVECGGGSGKVTIESFKDFQAMCKDASEAECKDFGCGGKYKEKKGCKPPKKSKQIKCKHITDMDLCDTLQCKAKRGKCKGKSKMK